MGKKIGFAKVQIISWCWFGFLFISNVQASDPRPKIAALDLGIFWTHIHSPQEITREELWKGDPFFPNSAFRFWLLNRSVQLLEAPSEKIPSSLLWKLSSCSLQFHSMISLLKGASQVSLNPSVIPNPLSGWLSPLAWSCLNPESQFFYSNPDLAQEEAQRVSDLWDNLVQNHKMSLVFRLRNLRSLSPELLIQQVKWDLETWYQELSVIFFKKGWRIRIQSPKAYTS